MVGGKRAKKRQDTEMLMQWDIPISVSSLKPCDNDAKQQGSPCPFQ